jgi:aldehyde:ferredoxin oxidoreductase
MVLGPGEAVVNMAGNRLDKEKFTRMVKEYYQLRGWDENTGVPLYETLKSFGLGDLATD